MLQGRWVPCTSPTGFTRPGRPLYDRHPGQASNASASRDPWQRRGTWPSRKNFDLRRWRRSAAEAVPEVDPLRIFALYQGDLPRARPALQRLLAADGRPDAVKHLEIDKGQIGRAHVCTP